MSTDSSTRAAGGREAAGERRLFFPPGVPSPPRTRPPRALSPPRRAIATCSRSPSSDVSRLQNPLRLRHPVTLRVIDAQAPQHVDDLLVLGELGNGLLAGQVPDFIDRTHHLAVDRIVQYLL